jgi:hypothetical protein
MTKRRHRGHHLNDDTVAAFVAEAAVGALLLLLVLIVVLVGALDHVESGVSIIACYLSNDIGKTILNLETILRPPHLQLQRQRCKRLGHFSK